MLKRLSKRKKQIKKDEGNKKVLKSTSPLNEVVKQIDVLDDTDLKEKELVKSTDVISVEDNQIEEEVVSEIFVPKEEDIDSQINLLVAKLEELVADEKVFQVSSVVRKDVENTIQALIKILENNTGFLNENEFVYKRITVLIQALGELVEKANVSRDFDTLLLSLSTLVSQSDLSKLQSELIESSSVNLTESNLTEVQDSLAKGEEVVTYVDNRDKKAKATSVLTEEQIKAIEEEKLKAIEEQEAENAKALLEEKNQAAREYLEQSEKISEALKGTSKYLISGKFRFLSIEERAEIEKDEFRSKFLGYIKKPSIYEMSVYELQRFAAQKGLNSFEGMSRDELIAFIENPLLLYGEKHITQNPYINRLKMELADNAALKDDMILAEAKIVETLKAAKSYSSKMRSSAITWQAFFVITLILVIAAIVGILVYFLVFR